MDRASGATTIAVQRYLDELGNAEGTAPAGVVVRALLERSVSRLRFLCYTMLHRQYPRLTRPPLGLQSDEMLSAVVERLIKALQNVRPETVRQFFALAHKHMQWELNELARQLDAQTPPVVTAMDQLAGPSYGAESQARHDTPTIQRILAAIDALPEEEREVFNLVRIQGVPQTEVAVILGVATKTVQRRLNRSMLMLSEVLDDLRVQGSGEAQSLQRGDGVR